MLKIKLLFVIIPYQISIACTVWGAITPNQLLIAKNRDFYPGNQKFQSVTNPDHYRFFGLYGDKQYNNKFKFKMGINESGLVSFITAASTIPAKQRKGKTSYSQIAQEILANYNNIDNIYTDKDKLFKNSQAVNYIFADRNKALICEIALDNNYKCTLYPRTLQTILFAQTNHYNIAELTTYNLTSQVNQQTSYYRYNKIIELMKNAQSSLNFNQFISMSFNTEGKNDSPPALFDKGYANTYQDNSIMRTFNSHPYRKNKHRPNSVQGVSTMIIELPKDQSKPVELYLRIIIGITDSNDSKFTQHVKYSEAITTLNNAINYPDSIKYTNKSCTRNINSKYCL